MTISPKDAQRIWDQYIAAGVEMEKSRYQLLTVHKAKIMELIAKGLRKPGERRMSLELISFLKVEDRRPLLAEILAVASYVCAEVFKARSLLKEFPQDWLIENIESAAEPILIGDDDEDYRRVLEVYEETDKRLAIKLARRAKNHSRAEIRAVGEEFLETLEGED
jgi:hypothetical protein